MTSLEKIVTWRLHISFHKAKFHSHRHQHLFCPSVCLFECYARFLKSYTKKVCSSTHRRGKETHFSYLHFSNLIWVAFSKRRRPWRRIALVPPECTFKYSCCFCCCNNIWYAIILLRPKSAFLSDKIYTPFVIVAGMKRCRKAPLRITVNSGIQKSQAVRHTCAEKNLNANTIQPTNTVRD